MTLTYPSYFCVSLCPCCQAEKLAKAPANRIGLSSSEVRKFDIPLNVVHVLHNCPSCDNLRHLRNGAGELAAAH